MGRHTALRAATLLAIIGLLVLAGCRPTRPGPEVPEAPPAGVAYRIQIFSTPDKPAADTAVEEALGWLDALTAPPEGLVGAEPVYVRYRSPYYRVQVGDFRSREQAEEALRLVLERYPRALIVPVQ